MVHGDLAQQARAFELRFENILLIALSHAIARLCDLFDLFQQLAVAFENPERLLEVGKPEIGRLQLLEHSAPDRLQVVAGGGRVALGHFASEPQFARVGQVLRDAKADIGEIAVRESSKRARAAHIELLHYHLGVRQG